MGIEAGRDGDYNRRRGEKGSGGRERKRREGEGGALVRGREGRRGDRREKEGGVGKVGERVLKEYLASSEGASQWAPPRCMHVCHREQLSCLSLLQERWALPIKPQKAGSDSRCAHAI